MKDLPVISVKKDDYAKISAAANADKHCLVKTLARHLGVSPTPVAVFEACMQKHNGKPCLMVAKAADKIDDEDLPDYVIITYMRVQHSIANC